MYYSRILILHCLLICMSFIIYFTHNYYYFYYYHYYEYHYHCFFVLFTSLILKLCIAVARMSLLSLLLDEYELNSFHEEKMDRMGM